MNAAARSCRPRFFPHKYWNQVPVRAVQSELRRIFSHWGRPQRLRVDNGHPWGSKGDWPTDLALWLIGLDVEMIWNPPRSPQDNGVVERSQGTGKRWMEPAKCRSVQELQQRADAMDRIQRDQYPSLAGRSRAQTYPELGLRRRPYSQAWEKKHWDYQLVAAHLANYSVTRRVDSKGQISIYGRNHYVGKPKIGQDVYLMFDPLDQEWIVSDAQGNQLKRHQAEEITPERIRKLQVTHRS